jgi:hypothetical protein
MTRALRTLTAITTLLLAGWSEPAGGQVLRGRLLDLDTDEPIAGGIVTLLSSEGEPVRNVVTGEDGMYELVAPQPGRYFVEARRIGYRSWMDGPVDLEPGDLWDSAFHLQAIPVRLDPVEISAPATREEAYLQRVGFYERQKADFGHFIGREQIEQRAPARLTDLLNSVPGVRLVPGAGGFDRAGISFQGSVLSQGGPCHPRVYIDGLIVIRGDARARGLDVQGLPEMATEAFGGGDPSIRPEIALDDVVMPEDVQAVEVYRRGSEVPARFGGMSTQTQCGAIVIWTRRGWQAQP